MPRRPLPHGSSCHASPVVTQPKQATQSRDLDVAIEKPRLLNRKTLHWLRCWSLLLQRSPRSPRWRLSGRARSIAVLASISTIAQRAFHRVGGRSSITWVVKWGLMLCTGVSGFVNSVTLGFLYQQVYLPPDVPELYSARMCGGTEGPRRVTTPFCSQIEEKQAGQWCISCSTESPLSETSP